MLCCLFAVSTYAQTNWTSLNGPWRASDARDITFGYSGATRVLYAADYGSRLVKSTTDGALWSTTGIQINYPLAVVCQPNNPQNVLVATFDGATGRVERSTNSGDVWVSPYPISETGLKPTRFGMSQADPQKVFLGTLWSGNGSTLRKSFFGGSPFDQDPYFFHTVQTNLLAVAWHPTDANKVWVGGSSVEVGSASQAPPQQEGTYFKTGVLEPQALHKGIWYSSNSGDTWSKISNPANISTRNISAVSVSVSGSVTTLWAGTAEVSTSGSKLYKSIDNGINWTEVLSYYTGSFTNISVNSANNRIYVSNNRLGISVSFDNGSTWYHGFSNRNLADFDARAVAVHPTAPNLAFSATGSSLFKGEIASAGVIQWQAINTGITQVTTSSVAASSGTALAVANNFSVVARYVSNAWNLNYIRGFANYETFSGQSVCYAHPSTSIAFALGKLTLENKAAIFRTTDGGIIWSEVHRSHTASSTFNFYGVVSDPKDANRRIAFGRSSGLIGTSTLTSNYFLTIDNGANWNARPVIDGATNACLSMAIDPTGTNTFSDILYAGLENTGIWKSTNAGVTWLQWSIGNTSIRTVSLNPSSPQTVYAGGNVLNGYGMWKSTNSGGSWSALTNRTDIVKKIITHPEYPNSTDHLIIIGDNGNNLYSTTNGGTNWVNITGNLPLPINDITFDQSNTKVFLAATSQGIFRIVAISPPQLTSPANNSTGIYYSTTLEWQAVSGAVSYSIQLADNPSFTNPINYTSKVGNKFTIKDLGYNKTYYWRVNSSNGLFSGEWSSGWSFQTVVNPPPAMDIMYNINSSWNMLSIPNLLSNYSPAVVWPQPPRSSNVFIYDGGYVSVSQIETGPGYFINFSTSMQKTYTGNPITLLPISVKKGWNIIGSISNTIPTSSITSEPPGLVESNFFAYQNGYINVSELVPGGGYWVKVSNNGQLLLYSAISKNVTTSSLNPSLDKFRITDSEGNGQDLFVANTQVTPELADIEVMMPPPIPFVNFDARFASGEYIKNVDPDNGVVVLNIIVNSENYPLTISYEIKPENGLNYSISFIPEDGLGKPQLLNVGISGNLVLPKAKDGIISLNTVKNKNAERPLTNMLNENYPNPFNPNTVISYSIAEPSNVKLVVHDILGREVKVLVNEYQTPGFKTVNFDAGDLTSGVYFYKLVVSSTEQLTAGSYTSVKKMILMR